MSIFTVLFLVIIFKQLKQVDIAIGNINIQISVLINNTYAYTVHFVNLLPLKCKTSKIKVAQRKKLFINLNSMVYTQPTNHSTLIIFFSKNKISR